MNTNSISSNKVTLKITTPQGKEMALNKGEVLQAQVQQVGDDGLVTIVVKGKPIEAYTEIAVKPGQQLLLMVDDVKQGKTFLKVVTPEIMGKIENTNLSAHLMEMGITAREENIALARKLLQHNLPVNQSNLNELNRNVSSLGGMNSRNLEIAAFALTRGMTGKSALESVAQFLSSPGDTAKLIPVLGRLLNALEVQNPNRELVNNTSSVLTSPAESPKLNGQFNQLKQALTANLTVETENQSASNIKQAPELLISGSKSNVASGNNTDQASPTGQTLPEGEEAGSSPKLIPAGIRADNSEASMRSQTPVNSGDKLMNATVKGEAPIEPSNSGSEKVVVEKPIGSGNDRPTIGARVADADLLAKNNLSVPPANGGEKALSAKIVNPTGVITTEEILLQDAPPASINKANASAANQIDLKNSRSAPAASGEGSNTIDANENPSNSSKAPEPLPTGNKPNVASGNNVNQTSPTGQALPEGEEAGSSPKFIPAGIRADNSEASMRSQTPVNSGDKLMNATVKGEAPIEPSNSGSEKVVVEKPIGSGNDRPTIGARVADADLLAKNNLSVPPANGGEKALSAKTINPTGKPAAEEISPQDDLPATINKANASADNKVKPELVERDAAITTGTKAEERLPGTRTATIAPASGNESPSAQASLVSDDEMAARLMESEASTAKKVASSEPLLGRESLKQEVFKLLDTVRSLMEIDLEAAPDKIAGKLQGVSNSEKDIVRALSLLVDMAKNQDVAKLVPELKDFSLSLDRLEKEITGQQLFNVSARNAADNISSFYYFAFPVKIDQEYSLCQLKINKDGRKSLKDVDKLSFVVSLNTSKLGVVLFHINWQKVGSLQLQGVAENQASCNYLNQNIGKLVSNLEELGYRVKNLGVKVSSTAEELQIRPVLQEVSERLRPLGIDVTV